jgi:hypothetical protein
MVQIRINYNVCAEIEYEFVCFFFITKLIIAPNSKCDKVYN